ncbi:MAG: pyridoxamine 5'-phosphate oxidase family protein [Chloroflexi bacterium]|nr:pyridoxamine 5'-phosphate oxidase family protein [Chloroflexota bacterium]
MTEIIITRPQFPKGYVDNPISSLSWDYVVQRLTESKNYWLCSVRPDSRPHSVPRWGVFWDGKLFYDGSPETRHARNILKNPHVSVHLESGDEALIAEGLSCPAEKPTPELAKQLSSAFSHKYEKFGYAPKPEQWDDGGLYVFTPTIVLAWTVFFENPTKFMLQ